MTKILKINPSSPRREYRIQGLPLATRSCKDNENILDDDWKFFDYENYIAAVFSTIDGEDFEEVGIDLTQGGVQLSDNLYERVGFTRDYVSEVLKARLEDENEFKNDDESIQSLSL